MSAPKTAIRTAKGQYPATVAPSTAEASTSAETALVRSLPRSDRTDGGAIASITTVKFPNRGRQLLLVEIRPEHVQENEFSISELPEQEVADSLLSAGADQQVGIGYPSRREEIGRAHV